MKIELEVETMRFQSVVKAMSIGGLIENPVIQFKENQLRIVNRDIANSLISCGTFEKKYFNKYEVTEEKAVAVNAEKLLRLTKQLSDDTVKVQVEPEKDRMTILTAQQKVKVPLIEFNETQIKLPGFLVENDGKFGFSEGSKYLATVKIPRLGKELEGLGERETTLQVINNKLMIKQETVDGYLIEQKLHAVEATDFSVMADSTYLKSLFDSAICEEVELKLDKTLPLTIVDKTSDYSLILALALRIEMEEATGEE